jgi:hypothetical protein
VWGTGLFSDDVACDVRDRVLSRDTRLFAFVMQQIDWERAGFRKVQTISVRADEQASLPSVGISWAELADRYRRRSAR